MPSQTSASSNGPDSITGRNPDISIISSGANLADARLHRLANALIRAGISVEIFAPGNLSDAPRIPTQSGLSPESEKEVSKLVIHPTRGAFANGKNLLSRYHRSRLYSLRARGKIFYVLSPEAVAPAYFQAKLRRRKIAVDFYEDYLRLLHDRGWAKKYFGIPGFLAGLDTKAALWFSSRADLTTVADVQVPPFKAKSRLVVRNMPDASLLTDSGPRSTRPRAIYIGDMRTSRGLRTMLEAAALAPDWEFDLVGPVAAGDAEYVSQWKIAHSHRSQPVRFHGKLTPRDAWKVAEGAWVGLSLLELTPAFVEAVPSKLYEYMTVGLATISTPLPRCIDLINRSGAGVIASTADEVAATLNLWASDPESLDVVKDSARSWAEENLDPVTEYDNLVAQFRRLLS
jgi:glycosyltransferase involved in cell wall biosynthesis